MLASSRALLRASIVFALLVTAGAMPAATFHTHLKKSAPAAGDSLAAPPREVRLWFSEKPEVVVSNVAVSDAAGAAVTLGKLRADSSDATQLVASVTGAMKPGRYQVAWRTMGADGHPVRGTFDFVILAAASKVSAKKE
jgi:methionine-rich copper-binding protein CopC